MFFSFFGGSGWVSTDQSHLSIGLTILPRKSSIYIILSHQRNRAVLDHFSQKTTNTEILHHQTQDTETITRTQRNPKSKALLLCYVSHGNQSHPLLLLPPPITTRHVIPYPHNHHHQPHRRWYKVGIRCPRGFQLPTGSTSKGCVGIWTGQKHRQIQGLSQRFLQFLSWRFLRFEIPVNHLRLHIAEQAHRPHWGQRQDLVLVAQHHRGGQGWRWHLLLCWDCFRFFSYR